jgi:hypothetical protein
MEVIVETVSANNTPESTQLREQEVRRVRSAMRSLSWLVLRARVKFSGGNETTGSLDKRCEVELVTEAGDPVVITSVARDWHSALQRALARASKSLRHRWQQEQNALGKRRMGQRRAGVHA